MIPTKKGKFEKLSSGFINNIPQNWYIKSARYLGRFTGGGIDKKTSENETLVRMINYLDVYNSNNGRVDTNNELMITTATEEKIKSVKVSYGDILITPSSETSDDIGHAAMVAEINEDIVYSYHLTRFIPGEELEPSFVTWAFNSLPIRAHLSSVCTGTTRMVLSLEDFKSTIIPVPPKPEQKKIANFLSKETAKIDELIQKQEKLIELVEEKQRAEILLNVTQGINFCGDYKNSTNIWLEKIPSHWDEGNLKILSRIYSGGTPDKSIQEYWSNGTVPWLNSGAVNDFYIHDPSEFITEDALNKSSAKWIPKGSILVALAGQGKTKGMAAQLMFDSTCNQSMCAVVPNSRLNAEYLHWWLHANYQNIRNLAGGDLRDGLNLEMIGSIKCPLPPHAEQVVISNYLKKLRNNNSKLIKKCKHSISLLKEHRASLISAAVTGKIDMGSFT